MLLNYSFCVYFYLPHHPYFSIFHSRIPICFEILFLGVLFISLCLSPSLLIFSCFPYRVSCKIFVLGLILSRCLSLFLIVSCLPGTLFLLSFLSYSIITQFATFLCQFVLVCPVHGHLCNFLSISLSYLEFFAVLKFFSLSMSSLLNFCFCVLFHVFFCLYCLLFSYLSSTLSILKFVF